MPFHIDWYLPFRVIDVRLIGVVTLADMRQQTEVIRSMLIDAEVQAKDVKVLLLLDTTSADVLPSTYLLLAQAMPVLRHKNRGGVFHITRSKTTRSIVELTAHVMDFSVRAFSNRAEAEKALEAALIQVDLG